jgi:hypothetical protein
LKDESFNTARVTTDVCNTQSLNVMGIPTQAEHMVLDEWDFIGTEGFIGIRPTHVNSPNQSLSRVISTKGYFEPNDLEIGRGWMFQRTLSGQTANKNAILGVHFKNPATVHSGFGVGSGNTESYHYLHGLGGTNRRIQAVVVTSLGTTPSVAPNNGIVLACRAQRTTEQ